MKSERIIYFDHFRGIAILLIVAGHCFMAFKPDTIFEMSVANSIKGGSALFVFISGFFFQAVFLKRFDYARFMKAKAWALLPPYLFLSTLYIMRAFAMHGEVRFPFETGLEGITKHIVETLLTLGVGSAELVYWYIPFILCMFALSPLFVLYSKASKGAHIAIFAATVVLSMLAHRADPENDIPHMIAFFTSFYLGGMLYAIYRSTLEGVLARHWHWFFIMALATSIYLSSQGIYGNQKKRAVFDYQGLDMMVALKFFTIAFLLGLLQRLSFLNLKLLSFLALISFPVYFQHRIFTMSLRGLFPDSANVQLYHVAMLTILSLVVTAGWVLLLKRLLPRHFQYITGK